MSRASSAAARRRRRQRSAIRLTAYQPEYEELARAWLTSDQEEAGGDGRDKWIHGDWQYRWVVMRGDIPSGWSRPPSSPQRPCLKARRRPRPPARSAISPGPITEASTSPRMRWPCYRDSLRYGTLKRGWPLCVGTTRPR